MLLAIIDFFSMYPSFTFCNQKAVRTSHFSDLLLKNAKCFSQKPKDVFYFTWNTSFLNIYMFLNFVFFNHFTMRVLYFQTVPPKCGSVFPAPKVPGNRTLTFLKNVEALVIFCVKSKFVQKSVKLLINRK